MIPTHDQQHPYSQPVLALEAAVLATGFSWANLPESTKIALGRSSSAAIRLWETTIEWYKPVQGLSLYTTPAVNYITPLVTTLSDFITRWSLAYVTSQGMKGRIISSKEDWATYIASPEPTYPDILNPFKLIITTNNDPVWVDRTPGNTVTNKGKQGQVATFTRKGKVIQRGVKKPMPAPTATPKYSNQPKTHFKLSPSALPPGTPQAVIDSAQESFAASISSSTHSAYKTTLVHLQKAEALLGQKFSSPPTNQEMVFFTSYLASKNIAPSTMRSYMATLRYISLSRGAAQHRQLPGLGCQIMAGAANLKKNSRLEATKPKRRPITINILRVLEHAIASHPSWTDYQKSLRWSVMLLGFWGSFRMAEIIQSEKSRFDPNNALLPSDLKFKEDAVAVWIRNPKVYKEGGDIVEVWSVEEDTQLDPIKALKTFLTFRNSCHGPAKDVPVFLHQDGSQFTKAEMNRDLKMLLAQYPALSTSQDKFSGHSFRAGIANMLASRGFSEQQIKSWGRWSSAAYRAYVQDLSRRRETRKQLTTIFGSLLARN